MPNVTLSLALFQAISEGNCGNLELFLTTRNDIDENDDIVDDSEVGFIEFVTNFEQEIAMKVDQEIAKIHKYSEQIGFNIQGAQLLEIFPQKTKHINDEDPAPRIGYIYLKLGTKDNSILIRAKTRTKDGKTKLLGDLVCSQLYLQDVSKLAKWVPGLERRTDERMAILIENSNLQKEWLRSKMGIITEMGGRGYQFQLPAMFSNIMKDIIYETSNPMKAVALAETQVNSLEFIGESLLILGADAIFPQSIKVKFNKNPFPKTNSIKLVVNGKERPFSKISEKPRTYRTPSVDVIRYGKKAGFGYYIFITFEDDIATKVEIKEIDKKEDQKNKIL